MDKNIIPFVYGNQAIRVIKDEEGNPWWIARDVCKALELQDANKAVRNLEEDEKGTKKVRTLGGEQNVITINEPGLYTLILRSNKPEAKPFKRWITHEVLPSIRKTGKYRVPGSEDGGSTHENGGKKSSNMYFPMAKLVESADKYLEGRAALKALNYFTGMPVEDLLDELEEKQASGGGWDVRSMAEHTARVRELVSGFMADRCEFGEEYTARASALYGEFRTWCEEREEQPITQKRFGQMVSSSFPKRKNGTVMYSGIRIKDSAAEAE